MVAPHNDDRIVAHAGLLKLFDHQTDLRIDVTNTSQIGVLESPRQFFTKRTALGNPRSSAKFKRSVQSHRRAVDRGRGFRCHRDIVGIVQVPVLFGRRPIQVWFLEPKCHEERLVFVLHHFLHRRDRTKRFVAVDIRVIGNVRVFISRPG